MENEFNKDTSDIYCYEGTETLINFFNYKDYDELKTKEVEITFSRLLELRKNPINLNFDINHLLTIHKYIFGDIYPFAGEIRNINIEKKGYKNRFLFAHSKEEIIDEINNIINEVKNDFLKCYGKLDFCEILAKLYTRLVYIHPFREGNGRTIREFIRELSIVKSNELGLGNLEIDWSLINKYELNKYVEVSHLVYGDVQLLFFNALKEIRENKRR